MLQRHSSRRKRLDHTVLAQRLDGAVSYDRIAGYFRSSLFEVAGEAIAKVTGPVRIICNSDLDPQDLITAAAAQAALRRSWCAGKPEDAPPAALPRYRALYEALTAKKIEVRVLPDSAFGLIHGKAGVVRRADGSRIAFMGSVNESLSAWKLNYELLWEDDDPETIAWVQEEFDALWNDARAVDLACCPFIKQDVERIISRKVIEPSELTTIVDPTVAAAAVAVESPVYRREQGLWPHQKYFARLALERHRLGGARLVLADQVGLGKTVQLAMAAMLMALDDPDGGPILVLAPKPLLQQWQDELMELLLLPSARWNGRAWVDENDLEYPAEGTKSLGKCPRRIGLVSQGLVVRGLSEAVNQLLSRRYTCVIVDEAHRARRRKVPKVDANADEINERADPNKLMSFLRKIGPKTKSMLLATATPVQLHPVEAWDLLHILSHGNEGVLGGWTHTSPWFQASRCLEIATGDAIVPSADAREGWQYVRDPLPSKFEDSAFDRIRRSLNASDSRWQFNPESLEKLSKAIQRVQLQNHLLPNYGDNFNPLLRCIVRRTRAYLEATINPATGGYFLPKVTVKLFGEDDDGALVLGSYLRDAYQEAEAFSQLLQLRVKGAGFFKTLLLRRLGSSMEAGRRTIARLLGVEPDTLDDEDEDDAEEEMPAQVGHRPQGVSDFKNFTDAEMASLRRCLNLLKQGGNNDPKLEALIGYLRGTHSGVSRSWLDLGCILFSQYYDTVRWIGDEMAKRAEFAGMDIGLYAGSNRSGLWRDGKFQRCDRNVLKDRVRAGDLKLLLGTDAASEGLNLQRLGTLINIDLPWNPTRLEQRKGRIQRIGQARNEIWIANLRYRGSVEDRVHQVLADRLEAIHGLFGQIPDTLEDVWVQVALHDEQAAKQLIDRTTATRNPFDAKYSKVEDADWETCASVLNGVSMKELLSRGW
ncbi:MAG: ATP-dependent helicase HepA [Candidatus Accumulibacter appositus]|uniref:ATP-dependent helicase HepA n=1 Tax=Candidatus Accumulibacter appositus TaxID=1454003 RepID=A0A011N7G4_9PROT|nr:phospholipase D-like domain-containing anti-phage protein [Accumulibacter sp.]EXI78523.1 MAG: ATP-dependent helicase HepA [Candidatus Accumulibacter appositus]HRF05935.1 phospholipase D-like domain-containing protein [Accumulibacter sp.]